jgi:hypothetical protein
VLLGVVEKFTAPETLTMLNRISRKPHPFPTAQWDVIRGSRTIARPNVPNSEAHIVPRLGRSTEAASFVYLREKKVFEPTTLYWLRTPGEFAKVNAERAVLQEITDLNTRFDNFAEYLIWQMFTGALDIPENGDAPAISVDYKMPASHKGSTSVTGGWAEATPEQIIADVRTLKRLILRDGQVAATEAYANEETISYIFDSFAHAGTAPAVLLSDRMKDQYYREGVLPGFLGLDWKIQDSVFDAAGAAYTDAPTDPGAEQKFLEDDHIIIGNFTAGRPFELVEGPTADLEAPQGFTGKFAKTWQDKDPSGRQYLLEWNMLPVLNRPEQFAYFNVGA